MGTYTQWAASKKIGRAVWVYGAEEVLKLEVAAYVRSSVSADDMDCLYFDAAVDDELAIWEAVYTRSLSDTSDRLVEIAHAEKLASTEKLAEWLKVHAKYCTETTVLLMAEEDPPACMKPPKATIIKCVMPRAEDKLRWAISIGGLSESSAKRLVEYKNGELEGIRDMCLKVSRLFPDIKDIELTKETLEGLDDETPYSLVEAILERDIKTAFAAIGQIGSDSIGRILSSLDYSLSLIDRLRDVLAAMPRGSKMEPMPGFPMSRVSELAPIARTYSAKEVASKKQLVAFIESYARQGIHEGLLEALVTLW